MRPKTTRLRRCNLTSGNVGLVKLLAVTLVAKVSSGGDVPKLASSNKVREDVKSLNRSSELGKCCECYRPGIAVFSAFRPLSLFCGPI